MNALLLVSLLTAGGLGWLAFQYSREARTWKRRSQVWFERAIAAGYEVKTTPSQAERIMADLSPRPMGAPSVVADVERQREWRERRALTGIDHHRRYGFGGESDAEIAEAVCAMWLEPEGE